MAGTSPGRPGGPGGLGVLNRADDFLQRIAIGLAVSLFVHVILLAVIFFGLAHERAEGDSYVSISLGASSPADTGDDVARDRLAEATRNVEPARPEAKEIEADVDVAERTQRIAESIAEAQAESDREWSRVSEETQAEREASEAARSAGLRGIDDQVTGNLERRGGMASLEPKTFFGLAVHTRRVIFVLDISGSMDIEFAKMNLRNAYRDLEETAYFGMVLYNHEVVSWKDRLVQATPENKSSADEFLESLRAFGATNIHDALQRAFAISADSITRADTIFFMTDGVPNRGPVIEPAGILEAVRRWNSDERVVIHAIHVVGPMATSEYTREKIEEARDFMKRLARENSGVYVQRD